MHIENTNELSIERPELGGDDLKEVLEHILLLGSLLLEEILAHAEYCHGRGIRTLAKDPSSGFS